MQRIRRYPHPLVMPDFPRYPTAMCIAALTTMLPCEVRGQALDAPTARWEHAFSRIGGVAELPDGRVVVVDNLDGTVYLGEAAGGTVGQLGRTGDGPHEYRRPWSVVRGLGDTLMVYAQNRLVAISPAGTIAGSYLFAPQALGGGVAPPRGVDREGRVYWDRVVTRDPATGALKRQQIYEIVRYRPGNGSVEVVATASDHAPEWHHARFHPFAQRDAWVVEPDGSVRIVRARDYSVDVVRERAVVSSSPPITFRPVEITGSDREAYRRDRAANAPGVSFRGRNRAGAGATGPAVLAQMRRSYPDEMFPRTKPPFVDNGVFRSPGGQLWVERTPHGVSLRGTRIDVLDATGRRIREITLPEHRHLLGLDRRGVYLVHEDEDGHQYLERYRWPAGLM